MSGEPVLIAAQSGRALAASARRAGFVPLVADLFGDMDTRQAAQRWQVAGDWRQGFRRTRLLAALAELAQGSTPGLVYGSGFEDRPRLLRAIGNRYAVLGNTAETVARVKDPFSFADLCRAHDIAHPQVAAAASPGWLVKRRGGSGGLHVRVARSGRTLDARRYAQRRVAGRAVSALFVADGQAGRVLGFSAQWSDPRPGQPFRYGGAVRPARLQPSQALAMTQAAQRLVPAIGLRGLNSADFLVDEDDVVLLEINPRPGAAMDVFPDAGGELFQQHVDACRGHLPAGLGDPAGAAAARIVYVPRDLAVPPDFCWPDWAADRQPPGSAVPADAPLCTVRAEAPGADAARCLLDRRACIILEAMTPA